LTAFTDIFVIALEIAFPQHCDFLYNALEVACFYSTTLK